MGISRRGNFKLALQYGADDESTDFDMEAEWAAQWEPTVPHIQAGLAAIVKDLEASDVRVDLEVVILLQPRRSVRVKLVA